MRECPPHSRPSASAPTVPSNKRCEIHTSSRSLSSYLRVRNGPNRPSAYNLRPCCTCISNIPSSPKMTSHLTVNVPYFNVEIDPSLPSTQLIIATALVILLPTLYLLFTYDTRRRHMPPYVRGWPIINQSLDHLSPHIHLLHQKWHSQYGDIYCTKSGATTFIWLSSPKVVKDLIDRRSAIYSSRPPLPLTSDVLSGGRRVAFMPRNNMWRYFPIQTSC
jgi:hypothetical protein